MFGRGFDSRQLHLRGWSVLAISFFMGHNPFKIDAYGGFFDSKSRFDN